MGNLKLVSYLLMKDEHFFPVIKNKVKMFTLTTCIQYSQGKLEQEKEINSMQTGNLKNLFDFINMIVYVNNFKNLQKSYLK